MIAQTRDDAFGRQSFEADLSPVAEHCLTA
jgi:hypothetical protein